MTITSMTHSENVQDFLAQKRIAVCGLSRKTDSGAGAIYMKLRAHGYQVFAVHPEAEVLHGDPCYASLSEIPGGVDAVFIMNSPDITEDIVKDAARLGIKYIWMHNNTLMPSSVSDTAVEHCHEAQISVISAGCPMMYLEPDFFHGCMCWVLRATGRIPRN